MRKRGAGEVCLSMIYKSVRNLSLRVRGLLMNFINSAISKKIGRLLLD